MAQSGSSQTKPRPAQTKAQQPKEPETPPKPKARDQERLTEGTVIGNLTQDPELRYTPNGRAVASLRVAETERVRNEETGEWSDGETYFYDVEVWNQLAENICNSLQRGDRVIASGTFWKRFFIDREQNEQERIYLRASEVGVSLLFRTVHIDRTQRGKGH